MATSRRKGRPSSIALGEGGPTTMSSSQVASYLENLRSYSSPRPSGARPLPSTRRSVAVRSSTSLAPSLDPRLETSGVASPTTSCSSPSHRRAQSELPRASPALHSPNNTADQARLQTTMKKQTNLGQSIIKPGAYVENGMRWMERQEAHSLREALQSMDLTEDARLHKAAQDEASELVWQHQNPNAAASPYRYRDHLRKGSYNRFHGLNTAQLQPKDRKSSGKRSSSGGSNGSIHADVKLPQIILSKEITTADEVSIEQQKLQEHSKEANESVAVKQPSNLKRVESIISAGRRRISGSLRKSSGGSVREHFPSTNEKIYEETTNNMQNAEPQVKLSPVPARRNPFARVRQAKTNSAPLRVNADVGAEKQSRTTRLDHVEIQRNPPSQSRNAEYTASSTRTQTSHQDGTSVDATSTNDDTVGLEIRDGDIRAATSMKFADRSPRLPTPVMVSDSPTRPIVSFREATVTSLKEDSLDGQPYVSHGVLTLRHLPEPRPTRVQNNRYGSGPDDDSMKSGTASQAEVSTGSLADRFTSRLATAREVPLECVVAANEVAATSAKHVSSSGAKKDEGTVAMSVPDIFVDSAETQGYKAESSAMGEPVTILDSLVDASDARGSGAKRPLPEPNSLLNGRLQRLQPQSLSQELSGSHITITDPPRGAALCVDCALPIAGRIVSAAGSRFHPECFRCHHCNEALECVAFYPEPEKARQERLDRIQARLESAQRQSSADRHVSVEDARQEAKDGYDASPRFFCHLDFHELFSPRCKSCKTPIEGEVVLACGSTWHKGHFFCAQCGDPFEARTPFVEKEGYAWCVGCHTNRFSSRCRKCRKPIVDTVIRAVGAEWCQGCFVCGECGSDFVGGTYFVRGGQGTDGMGGNVVCRRCEERRLKA